ncbi:MAG TPA: proline--tRNA ligase [Candidatus Ornithospirochaeta avicola]|uniref:Proline--tRNA ligase n=1 Tax=Candidatus Ornithospirochaeta avicola TaxID=2840896 RepID=A0A9D1PUH3_9SPIO|nr:proline--tRNA ligase [Candidatus Ornithospirochaeta avicola]
MRMSKMFSRTLREAPSGADSKGYEYLLRAGYIKQLGAGIFSLLPLGLRSIRKIENIVRQEMNRIGCEEIQMPLVNPADIWKESGRYYSIDKELARFEDRTGRDMVLAMTHEEACTTIARDEIDSYKRLPVTVYQIQTKFRDDPRPRAGLIRVREFTMKDAYSFDRTQEGLEKSYRDQYKAYFRIFSRCALPAIAVKSDTGMMGGSVAHEYMYLSPIGEDTIITCSECGYTANRQVASFKKDYKKEEMKDIQKVATPDAKTIEELCTLLNIKESDTCKAVFMVGTFTDENNEEKTRLIVALVRGDLDVEEAKLQHAAGANEIRPAHDEEIRECGMVPGFASPIGAKGDFILIVDDSVSESNNLVAGANEEGYHLMNTNFGRDFKGTVKDIASARSGHKCPHCGSPLNASKGVEIGNIFQLGTKYSQAMKCEYQDEDGTRKPVIMGCYGIGIGRLLACVAEEYNDEGGLKMPISVAPYQVHLVSLIKDTGLADSIYDRLIAEGIEVLYDDRKESAGVKFADADLIGVPLRITLGNKSIKEGKVEVRIRSNGEVTSYSLDTMIDDIKREIAKEEKKIEDGIINKELED